MLSRLLFVSAVATLFVSGASARLAASDIDMDQFETQGLEELQARYGTAYPGYEGVTSLGLGANVVPNQYMGVSDIQNQQFQFGAATTLPVNWQQTLTQQGAPVNWQQSLTQQAPVNWQQQFGDIGSQQFGDIDNMQFADIGMNNINPIQTQQFTQRQLSLMGVPDVNVRQQRLQQILGNQGNPQLGLSQMDMVNLQQPVSLAQIPQYQQQQPKLSLASTATVMPNYQQPIVGGFGGIGMLGAGAPNAQGGTSKGTTVAQPIYAQNMVVPKIITQPIYRPHSVTQPILQQQLIQQPIVETRQVIQPVIRRIITQPIIRPEIYESTTIQPTLKTETVVQPRIIQQTVITPQLQNEYSEQAPIQEKAKTNVAPTQVQPTVSGKKQTGGLGLNY